VSRRYDEFRLPVRWWWLAIGVSSSVSYLWVPVMVLALLSVLSVLATHGFGTSIGHGSHGSWSWVRHLPSR
jgi:hypothetical protein